MNELIDELYLTWLYGQVSSVKLKNPSRTFWSLLRQLYTKEFIYIVPNDDNRAVDGKDLRHEFINDQGLEDVDPEWLRLGCSMLELLIGLARTLSFEADGEVRSWFWEMMNNLELDSYNDQNGVPFEDVDDVLERVIWRTYLPDGSGGLFPLNSPKKDQRKIELWYQLSSYILENEYIA